MKNQKLEEGDTVTVIYVDGTVLANVKLVHIPWDTGDSWHFINNDGALFVQNPVSSNLDTIIRLPAEQE